MDKQLTNKTLLEILVDELPELGGWPDVAFNIAQDKSGFAWFYLESPIFRGSAWCGDSDKSVELPLATDHATTTITREQYEQALADKNKPAMPVMPQHWNGEGLPPVGTVCTVTPHNSQWGFDSVTDRVCEILAYTPDHVWVREMYQTSATKSYVTTRTDKADFRPIRTPEQIEAERRERISNAFLKAFNDSRFSGGWKGSDSLYTAIYDAIRAGKIEGVKIDEHL